MMTGGLIFKNALSDERVLEVLRRQVRFISERSFEDVTGPEFHEIGIAHKAGVTFVFGRDLTHSIAFERGEASKLNDRLEAMPERPAILVYLINTVSDTYAVAQFEEGKLVAAKSFADNRVLSDFHAGASNTLAAVSMNDEAILQHIRAFSGFYLPNLAVDATPVNVYASS